MFAAPLAGVAPDPLAKQVEELTRLAGALELKLTEANEQLSELSKTRPPIGTVVMWWGDRASVPPGWEVCDGKPVETNGAILTGTKPNLVDRFPKGATAGRNTVADLAKAAGGSNNLPALKLANISGLAVGRNGEHEHRIPTFDGSTSTDRNSYVEIPNYRGRTYDYLNGPPTEKGGAHEHPLTGFVGDKNGKDADGGDTSGANQPAYQELFFLIRVK